MASRMRTTLHLEHDRRLYKRNSFVSYEVFDFRNQALSTAFDIGHKALVTLEHMQL